MELKNCSKILLMSLFQIIGDLFFADIFKRPTYITYLPTLPTYLHYLPTYIIYLPTLPTYLHYLPTYITYLPTLFTYLHYLPTNNTLVHYLLTYITFLPTLFTYLHYIHLVANDENLAKREKHRVKVRDIGNSKRDTNTRRSAKEVPKSKSWNHK